MNRNLYIFSASVACIGLFSGCDWLAKKTEKPAVVQAAKPEEKAVTQEVKATGNVLMTIDGKPVITKTDFDEFLSVIKQLDPRYEQELAIMPGANENFFNELALERLMNEFIKRKGIDTNPEYQKDLRMARGLVDKQIATKWFLQKYPEIAKITISDNELRKAYDENKDQFFVKSLGGVNGQLVTFDSPEEAQAFFEKAKVAGTNFEQLAKDAGKTVKPFKNVFLGSVELDPIVTQKVVAVAKFPTVDLVKGTNKAWVFKATSKQPKEYVPLSDLKENLKNELIVRKILTEEVDKLKKEYNVDINSAFFEDKKKDALKNLEDLRKKQEPMPQVAPAKKEQRQTPKVPTPSPVKSM